MTLLWLSFSFDGMILPLKIKRMVDCGIVVALDASSCNLEAGHGHGSSIGMRRGGLVRERDIESLLLLLLVVSVFIVVVLKVIVEI